MNVTTDVSASPTCSRVPISVVVATVCGSLSALASPFSSSLSERNCSLSRASPLKPETAESDACESLQVRHRERRSIIYELRLSVYQTDARSVYNH